MVEAKAKTCNICHANGKQFLACKQHTALSGGRNSSFQCKKLVPWTLDIMLTCLKSMSSRRDVQCQTL